MESKFEIRKTYKDGWGEPITIKAVIPEAAQYHQLLGMTEGGMIRSYSLLGRDNCIPGKLDLILPKKMIKVDAWINVYASGDVCVHKTKALAVQYRGVKSAAMKHIQFEIEEGTFDEC